MQSHNTFIVRAVRRLPLYSVIVWWLLPTSAVAQQSEKQDTTLQRSVVVEQTYTLQIGEARKVNILPPIPELSSHPRAVEYSLRQHPIENVPQSPTAHALARTETPLPAPGYLRIGYGNNGNADVLGNYTFRLSGRDRLNISGSFNGMNAKLPMQSAYPDMPTKWAHRFYSTRIGADYLHNFSGISLGVSGTFGVDNYNFLPLSLFSRQRNTQADARLALSSTNEDAPMQYVINLQYLTFQRHSVADDIDQDLTPENGLLRENQLRLSVDFWSPVTEESRIGIAGQAEQRTYDWEKYKNPLFVQLTPYYLLTSGLWNIRLGMHVMFQSGMEKTLRVAPDVYAGLTIAERVTLFAQATGGVVSNDQRQLLRINPFAMSHRTQLENSFETYHARLGIKAGFNGIGIRADAGLGEMRNALIDRNSSSGIIFDPTSEA
ncbi:MAG: hypothetical protein LBM61_01650, partial [Prevotellaceae bacterium]|nr:hypothetical protein [Prevotellaceae bacterium]